jgi:hypothetical protein
LTALADVDLTTVRLDRLVDTILSVNALSVVDRWFDSRSGQSKVNKTGICSIHESVQPILTGLERHVNL